MLHGLKVVASAVLAQAVWGMARNLTPDAARVTLAVLAAAADLAAPTPLMQVAAIISGGLAGVAFMRTEVGARHLSLGIDVGRGVAITSLILFFALLIRLPLLAAAYPGLWCSVAAIGPAPAPIRGRPARLGHERRLPRRLWRGARGARAAVHVLGLSRHRDWTGAQRLVRRGNLSRCQLRAVRPFDRRRVAVLGRPATPAPCAEGVARGHAAVAGLLLVALYRPVWTSGILSLGDFGLALGAFTLLVFWKVPPWLVVILTAGGGWGLQVWAGLG